MISKHIGTHIHLSDVANFEGHALSGVRRTIDTPMTTCCEYEKQVTLDERF
jgi:hypothetical protein